MVESLGLTRSLYIRGYNREQVVELFHFIGWMIRLPEMLEYRLVEAVKRVEEEFKMPYINTVEQYGIKQGIEQGIELKKLDEKCSVNRVARLMKQANIRALRGYRVPRHHPAGKPEDTADNILNREFNYDEPDKAWVTDITYIETREGFLYLAVVLDLCTRRVVGWSMKERMTKEIVLDALLMALWRRRPKGAVIIHSDQGSQFTSDAWMKFIKDHNLTPSMSRRGNCWDNAVVESFFGSLKKERIRRKVYTTREDARSDIFDYIEVFYNRKRSHSYLGQMSPVEYEEKNHLSPVAECL